MDKFAKLWTASEYEYKATVTATGRMEISDIVDSITNKCHMAVIQVAGMHHFFMEVFCLFS